MFEGSCASEGDDPWDGLSRFWRHFLKLCCSMFFIRALLVGYLSWLSTDDALQWRYSFSFLEWSVNQNTHCQCLRKWRSRIQMIEGHHEISRLYWHDFLSTAQLSRCVFVEMCGWHSWDHFQMKLDDIILHWAHHQVKWLQLCFPDLLSMTIEMRSYMVECLLQKRLSMFLWGSDNCWQIFLLDELHLTYWSFQQNSKAKSIMLSFVWIYTPSESSSSHSQSWLDDPTSRCMERHISTMSLVHMAFLRLKMHIQHDCESWNL